MFKKKLLYTNVYLFLERRRKFCFKKKSVELENDDSIRVKLERTRIDFVSHGYLRYVRLDEISLVCIYIHIHIYIIHTPTHTLEYTNKKDKKYIYIYIYMYKYKYYIEFYYGLQCAYAIWSRNNEVSISDLTIFVIPVKYVNGKSIFSIDDHAFRLSQSWCNFVRTPVQAYFQRRQDKCCTNDHVIYTSRRMIFGLYLEKSLIACELSVNED